MPPLVRPIRRPRWSSPPLFRTQARRRSVRRQIGRINHHRLRNSGFGGQTFHHSGEDALVAPSLPTVLERLWRAIFPGRIAPPQAIAIDEDNTAQDTPVIDPWHTMALRKKRPKPGHLCVRQPEKIAHRHPRQFGSLNHAAEATSSRSIGPDPRRRPHQGQQEEPRRHRASRPLEVPRVPQAVHGSQRHDL